MKLTEQNKEPGEPPCGHGLSAALEKYIRDKSSVAEDAWRRLADMISADLRCRVRGTELTKSETLHLIKTSEDPLLRREAYAELSLALRRDEKVAALIVNTLANLKSADCARRGNDNPWEDCPRLGAALESCLRLSHRYYAWKAKKTGVAKLHPADCRAPLPGNNQGDLSSAAEKIEALLDTVEQAAVSFVFERKIYQACRDDGELRSEMIAELWLEAQREILGPSVDLDVAGARDFWVAAPPFCASADAPALEKDLSVIEEHIDALLALDRKIEAFGQARQDFKETGDDITIIVPPPGNRNWRQHPQGPVP